MVVCCCLGSLLRGWFKVVGADAGVAKDKGCSLLLGLKTLAAFRRRFKCTCMVMGVCVHANSSISCFMKVYTSIFIFWVLVRAAPFQDKTNKIGQVEGGAVDAGRGVHIGKPFFNFNR